jgi:HEAT repeat protein
MGFKSAHLAPAVAVIAIVGAMAAVRPSAEEPRSEAALKRTIAELRAEVARLRAGDSIPGVEPPPAGSGETPSPGSGRQITTLKRPDAPIPLEEIRALLRSRSRAEQGLGLKALESNALRADRLALLQDMMQGGNAGMNSRGLSLLKTIGGADATALAVGVLQKAGPSWLRCQAASVLGDLGDSAALSPLLDASRTDDFQVRAAAVAALDQVGHAAPLRELIATLADMLDHPDGRVREDAVELLSTFRTPAVLPTLAKALGDRTNSRIREAAANALGQTRLAEAIPCLEGALNDSEPVVRRAAQQALDALRASRK